ncbi:MAG TPA: fibronectin type III domain-containing protein, partial [Gemmatimonadales bacterium]|nr:fibronectin type III domain-containing protein [Gemmatimonadales bacterium]
DDPVEPRPPSFMTVNPPASLAAAAVAFNQINLSWQDNATNESGFEVYRSSSGPAGTFALIVTTGAGATSYGDYGLAALTQYCYKLRTVRVTGRKNNYSDYSNVACATTPRVPVPLAASGVRAQPIGGYAISVIWTDNSTDETGFRIERAASASGPWTNLGTLSANSTGFNDWYPPAEQSECYRVIAVNGYGDATPSNVFCTVMPAAPSNLAATTSSSGVDLTWTDNSSFEDGFNVWRAAGTDSSIIAHLAANALSYHDAIVGDRTFSYSVEATRDGGMSFRSNIVQVVIATVPPLAPSSVQVIPSSSSSVTLYWSDNSTNEAGFRIERSSDGGASWVAAGNADMNYPSFSDYGLASEQAVCYRVVAFNGIGDSPASDPGCTIPPAGPTDLAAIAIDDYTVNLTWTDNSAVEDGYEIWVSDGYYGPWAIADLPANTTAFQVTGYYAYAYYFYVVALKDGGVSDYAVTYASPAGSASIRGSAAPRFAPRVPSLQLRRQRAKP